LAYQIILQHHANVDRYYNAATVKHSGYALVLICYQCFDEFRPNLEVRTSKSSGLEVRTSNSVEKSY